MSKKPVIYETVEDHWRPVPSSGPTHRPGFTYESTRKIVNREKRRFKREFQNECALLGIDFETNWNAYCERMKKKGWRI